MKKSGSQMQAALADSLQTNLHDLSEKYAKKLQKTVVSAAKKITSKLARLLDREHKAGKAAVVEPVSPELRKAPARRVGKQVPRLTAYKKVSSAATNS